VRTHAKGVLYLAAISEAGVPFCASSARHRFHAGQIVTADSPVLTTPTVPVGGVAATVNMRAKTRENVSRPLFGNYLKFSTNLKLVWL
jgi:hypothetical protein